VSEQAQRWWVAVIGDRTECLAPQDTIAPAVADAAAALGVDPPETRWLPSEALASSAARAGTVLAGAAAVWAAPGGPHKSMEGMLAGIRWSRETGTPFLGTCAGFQLAVVEFARNVLGHERASHAEYDPEAPKEDLFIDELLCSLAGQTMRVRLVDDEVRALYGAEAAQEQYYCHFGLHPAWRQPVEEAGLRVAGVDERDGDARILRLADHEWFVLTLFVPQVRSTRTHPHPLVTGWVRAATARLVSGTHPRV
jgi:CTP synthase (UTP-ammonia lyase)